jgi:hypothetical protein
MQVQLHGKSFWQVPGVLALGYVCSGCGKPNQQGNGFVFTRKGMKHRGCVRVNGRPTR